DYKNFQSHVNWDILRLLMAYKAAFLAEMLLFNPDRPPLTMLLTPAVVNFFITTASQNSKVDIEDLPILYWASVEAPLLFVEDLLRMSSRKYRNLDTCLVHAAECGHANSVSRLIESGADSSWNDNEALRLSFMLGHKDVVCALLNDLRTDPSAKSSKVLIAATQRRHHTVVRSVHQIFYFM
ncbi:hypothetical protein HDU80_000243, partial [Chytriomyces hyalinus]